MKSGLKTLLVLGALVFLAAPAMADWIEGDGHKMHFPQMPDPNGWDVAFYSEVWVPGDPTNPNDPGSLQRWPNFLADDWQCSQTGPVSDIHFWVSSRGDDTTDPGVVPFVITSVDAYIWGDVPQGHTANPYPFSVPDWWGVTLGSPWRDFHFTQDEIQVRWAGNGQEGWLDPHRGEFLPTDHFNYYQVNIKNIVDPFIQEQGTIYWLELTVDAVDAFGNQVELGWKTADTRLYPTPNTGEHFMDDATYWYMEFDPAVPGAGPVIEEFRELIDPFTQRSLDLAFVITPEPGTLGMLLGAGLVGLVGYVRRRRRP